MQYESLTLAPLISVIAKDFLALVTADNHVVKGPFEFHPRFSRHASDHSEKDATKSILRPDPGLQARRA
jgi:hypothetical protein